MQAPEQIYADVLRTLYHSEAIDFAMLDKKIDELHTILFRREREESR